jgi:hypothetical protein
MNLSSIPGVEYTAHISQIAPAWIRQFSLQTWIPVPNMRLEHIWVLNWPAGSVERRGAGELWSLL